MAKQKKSKTAQNPSLKFFTEKQKVAYNEINRLLLENELSLYVENQIHIIPKNYFEIQAAKKSRK